MDQLDIRTLLVVSIFVLFLLASLMLLASLQVRRDPCLLWVSAGLALAGLGITCSALSGHANLVFQVIWLGNVLLVSAHASIWTALRRFSGRPTHWWLFAAGGVAWTLLCLVPGFLEAPSLRVLTFSILCGAYFAAAIAEILPGWRRSMQTVIPFLVILTAYIVACTYRAIHWHMKSQFWVLRSDSSITLFILMLMAIGVAFSSLILVRGREEARYRHASQHDGLTGLLNRRALFERAEPLLDTLAHTRQDAALLMFDLDWFKQVNDLHGHRTGDHVLQDFASSLFDCTDPDKELCARVGGEEFVVLIPGADRHAVHARLERIRAQWADRSQHQPVSVSASVGIALASDAGYRLDALLQAADQALYQAKADGRDCARFWSDGAIEPLHLHRHGIMTS
ncbi:diguanylate cyclase domain-containing protein [Castellaniella sp.]|uniref:GGDEF domain-containing protein n=1 Tax=Castellaniella sp. TaxID=1955812 RepID=UPI00355F9E86